MEDRNVTDKRDWDQAVRFTETSIMDKLKTTEKILSQMLGPGRIEQWFYWRNQTKEQQNNRVVKNELNKILNSDKVRGGSENF